MPKNADTGSDPKLVEPVTAMIPTVNIAPAAGWPAGGKPVVLAGLAVSAYATGLDHPRSLYVRPNGNVVWRGTPDTPALKQETRLGE